MSTRVLYVDDEPDIREVAEMSLQLDPALDVRTAASGVEALEIVKAWRPGLIILDVMMPRLDGPATLAALRADPSSATIPVVFITARTQVADIKRFMSLGALGVIAKPFDPLQLAAEVRKLMREEQGG